MNFELFFAAVLNAILSIGRISFFCHRQSFQSSKNHLYLYPSGYIFEMIISEKTFHFERWIRKLKDTKIILLLIGGDKSAQQKDIGKAKKIWNRLKSE